MLTADTITDDQLRGLLDDAGTLKDYIVAAIALDDAPGGNPVPDEDRKPIVRQARARCAEILNARATSCSCGHPRESHDLDDACASCNCRSFEEVE